MTTIEKLRTVASETGEAWDYDRRRLPAQRTSAGLAASAVNQADSIQDEDAMFEDPPAHRPAAVPRDRLRKIVGFSQRASTKSESLPPIGRQLL